MHSYECKLKETPWTWSIIYIVVICKRLCSSTECSTFWSSIALFFSEYKGIAEWFLHLSDMAKTLNTCTQCALLAAVMNDTWREEKRREKLDFYNEIHFNELTMMNREFYSMFAQFIEKYFQHFSLVRDTVAEKAHTKIILFFQLTFFRGQRILYGN